MNLLSARGDRVEGAEGLKCVLLVEDETNDALLACRELDKLGLQNAVSHVGTFAEMVSYLKGEGEFMDRDKYPLPAVIIIDMNLPDGDAFHVQAWVRATLKFRETPLIVISSDERLTALKTAVELGADGWMTKPFEAGAFERLTKTLGLDLAFDGANAFGYDARNNGEEQGRRSGGAVGFLGFSWGTA